MENILGLTSNKIEMIGATNHDLPLLKFLTGYGFTLSIRSKEYYSAISSFGKELKFLGIVQNRDELILSELIENQDVQYLYAKNYIPEDDEYFIELQNNKKLRSEIDLFLENAKATVIIVTGSFGKATTSQLVYDFLISHGVKSRLLGMDDTSILECVENISHDEVVVLCQPLGSLKYISISPAKLIITNISPYPLDGISSYEDKIMIIKKLCRMLKKENELIYNYDNKDLHNIAKELLCKCISYSEHNEHMSSIFIKEGEIFYEKEGNINKVPMNLFYINSNRAVESYMAAIAATIYYTSINELLTACLNFKGAKNHMELVKKDNKVFINNAFSSSPAQVVASFQPFKNKLILISGGLDDAEHTYKALGMEIVAFVKILILVGSSSNKIRKSTINYKLFNPKSMHIYIVDSLDDAITKAYQCARENDTILYSPANKLNEDCFGYLCDGEKFRNKIESL